MYMYKHPFKFQLVHLNYMNMEPKGQRLKLYKHLCSKHFISRCYA